MRECINCGRPFRELTVTQKYCSPKCGLEYRRKRGISYPSITFKCARCGKIVVTNGKNDRRTRFCGNECEKKFWRHPNRYTEFAVTNTNYNHGG